MKSRRGSGVRLDRLLYLAEVTILKYQNPITGLFANNIKDFPHHAWVRDNLYAAHAIWAMYRAYQKSADFDEDLAKTNELGLLCVKMMQSLLECMMLQADKVELFKKYQRKSDALHAKYSTTTKRVVVSDIDWGHLQIDATSLFLLTLAQMTSSGLQIVRNFDEVAFVQNLVYYVETGYRTPDYGIWERGDKTNQGIRELNASSIGMVKAALQALDDVGDLFGDGSKGSIIHVLPDQIQQCSAVLTSMLPRESSSKETDLALLTVISYPAFSVEESGLINLTRETVIDTLLGRYGCRRFLRDGYKTPLEDPSRLYYNNAELQQFEDIECEWPLGICYLLLDAMFTQDEAMIEHYWEMLNQVTIVRNGCRVLPELYKVPYDKVADEKEQRGSQEREADGAIPYLWAQSLYIICCLVYEGFLTPPELDPLGRRLFAYEKRPPPEVQVCILAETYQVQQELLTHDIVVQCVDEVDEVFSIQPAFSFAKILSRLGESEKLCLTGRPMDIDIGTLSTSKLYQLGQKFIIFTPQFMDRRLCHLMYDIRILMDEWISELQYLYRSWNSSCVSGRPLVVLIVAKSMLEADSSCKSAFTSRGMMSTVVGTIKKIASGYIGGARVVMKNLSEFFRTTAVSQLVYANSYDLQYSVDARFGSRNLLTVIVDPQYAPRPKRTKPEKYQLVHKVSMRRRTITLNRNEPVVFGLYNNAGRKQASPISSRPVNARFLSPLPEKHNTNDEFEFKSCDEHLKTVDSSSSIKSSSSDSERRCDKMDYSHFNEMSTSEILEMLNESNVLEDQATLVHYLWMKHGLAYDTGLNGVEGATVSVLAGEVHIKACECREWSIVRLTAGLLKRQLEGLDKAVTNLLVRQKQITVGVPSMKEETIICPKTSEELRKIFDRAYGNDPNCYILAQEIIIYLGSLALTEFRIFVEMFRLRVGLIMQVLASELARLHNTTGDDATQDLLKLSPFEVKSMVLLLISGRVLEDFSGESNLGAKEQRSGLGSIRKQIEERKSVRKSLQISEHQSTIDLLEMITSDDEDSDGKEDYQFGIWLWHRRIDGALNRVPQDFYESIWDILRRFSHGLSINHIILHWSFTQEMTRRETKFATVVEEVLSQIAEPEYRELIVEALALFAKIDVILRTNSPNFPRDRPIEIDSIVSKANQIFISHNVEMDTIVMNCCGKNNRCSGAQGICLHFYDSAPAGEYGTANYITRAIIELFRPNTSF